MKNTKEKVIATIEKMSSLHINDPRFSDYYDEIVAYLSIDVDETIDILDALNEEQISWISTSWDDVSARLQNSRFIEAIKKTGAKYPDIPLIDFDIECAIQAMDND